MYFLMYLLLRIHKLKKFAAHDKIYLECWNISESKNSSKIVEKKENLDTGYETHVAHLETSS